MSNISTFNQFTQIDTGYNNKFTVDNETEKVTITQLSWRGKLVAFLQNIPLIKLLISSKREDIATQTIFLKALAAKYGESTAWGVANKYQHLFTEWGNPNESGRPIQPLRSYHVKDIIHFAENLSARYPLANSSTINIALKMYARDKDLQKIISTQEYVAIRMYTGSNYTMINEALRGNDPRKLTPWQALIDDATTGLKKLAEHGYHARGLLLRGITIPKNNKHFHIDDYQEGKTIKDKAFVSTSSDQEVAQHFINSSKASRNADKVLLHLFTKGNTGAHIEKLSIATVEKEALIQPNTSFFVLFRAFSPKANLYKVVLSTDSSATDGTKGYVESLDLASSQKRAPEKKETSRLDWLDLPERREEERS